MVGETIRGGEDGPASNRRKAEGREERRSGGAPQRRASVRPGGARLPPPRRLPHRERDRVLLRGTGGRVDRERRGRRSDPLDGVRSLARARRRPAAARTRALLLVARAREDRNRPRHLSRAKTSFSRGYETWLPASRECAWAKPKPTRLWSSRNARAWPSDPLVAQSHLRSSIVLPD